ncbi:MAG TPA: thiamine pyrophosphate-binding protein [Vicinamibacterales bacterium]|nr:thiamine pyrophosphate-binding protein [Vicinamibacterales bacterium]
MPTVAAVIVSALRDAGVHTLFGVPGGGSNLDIIAAAGRAGLPFVLTSHETAAALAAIAQAEITGRPGACLTTLGPGAASVVNGVACAFLDRVPLVVFSDSHPIAAAGAFEHQRLDQAALLSPITKSSAVLSPDNASQVAACAIRTSLAYPAGPVHLECPGDVASATAEPHRRRASEAPPPVVAASVPALVSRARKPLLLVGLGARRREDAEAVRRLCERRHVPAMVTYKAKGVVPDDHAWFAGVFSNATIEQPVIADSDLLIGIGLDPVELIPRRWAHEQPIVYCGQGTVEDRHVPFAAQMVTDVPTAAGQLAATLAVSDWNQARLRQQVSRQRREVSIPAAGLPAHRVVEIAAARLASVVGRVTVDAGAHMFPATMLWPASEPNHLLISNGLSTMGFALPAAIGAALLDRSRAVVVLTGDGGLLMCLGELLTAVRESLRIIVIVFSDASLSLIEIKQQARQLTPAGVSLGAVDWPALAASFGVAAWVASDEAELDRAVHEAQTRDGPSLIEAKIDRSNYGATLRAVRGA